MSVGISMCDPNLDCLTVYLFVGFISCAVVLACESLVRSKISFPAFGQRYQRERNPVGNGEFVSIPRFIHRLIDRLSDEP